MTILQNVALSDRFDLTKSPVLLNGTQALVRLMLMQKARDRAAGLNTAGYVTGYRGSPLGAVDQQMRRAEKVLTASDVKFHEGLNEDLAATALWGTQQAELRGEGRFDGVFGLWYGKGPGVDRTGDVFRHANMAGTSRHGGVLVAMGDDHTGESSTVCHQSDWAMIDAYIPILSPSGVQEILDFGLYGFALSRYSGLWAGLKTMKDTVEVTSIVEGNLDRAQFVIPDHPLPAEGLNIRLGDHWVQQEARMIDQKRFAAEAFAHANRIDRRVWGKPGAKIGLVAAGKSWLDLEHGLRLLGIDGTEADRLGITTLKIGQIFPMDMKGFHDWAEGLDLIIVVEEKRKIIEVQIKEAIFDDRRGRRVYGWYKGGAGGLHGEELFPVRGALDPVMVARKLGAILIEEGRSTDRLRAAITALDQSGPGDNAPDIAKRTPFFCSGCPHNTSTKLPEGARAYAGIGCHTMALWMDRGTSGFTQMGGEGANWIGEAPFSTTAHVFQNLGDGTYNHSGIQAIRAALASDVNLTYKILFNDAVAMTGGQPNEGGLTAYRIAAEVRAIGVQHLFVVHDEKEPVDPDLMPKGVEIHPRAALPTVQARCREIPGVSVILYVQTCAAEKRRKRKRGQFPDPDQRVLIDTDICEGCGDCGVQSNCVSIVPVETEFGRKRAIDQSSCNKDFSCLQGFCPSFVTLSGAKPRKAAAKGLDLPPMAEPVLPVIQDTWNIVITGVGGTGVVTLGAILAQAAQLDGKGAGMMEMAGLAQKGGAVHVHCRLANRPGDISAVRVASGECDALIGGDLVVSGGAQTLGLTRTGRTGAVVNAHQIITGDFTRNPDFFLPADRLALALDARIGAALSMFDATDLAAAALGDSVFSNMIVLGAAWQKGLVPLSHPAIAQAIRLNGAQIETNLRAFEIGRWAVAHPGDMAAFMATLDPAPLIAPDLNARIAQRAAYLVVYQDHHLADRYLALVAKAPDDALREAIALGYHKALAYKDEYEVARLLSGARAKAAKAFDGDFKLTFHLAPPVLSGKTATGRPAKRAFGQGWLPAFRVLARLKGLRGTWADPFGRNAERRQERALIALYEADMAMVLDRLTPANHATAVALARLPLDIRGFGPVKDANHAKTMKERDRLLALFKASPTAPLAPSPVSMAAR